MIAWRGVASVLIFLFAVFLSAIGAVMFLFMMVWGDYLWAFAFPVPGIAAWVGFWAFRKWVAAIVPAEGARRQSLGRTGGT